MPTSGIAVCALSCLGALMMAAACDSDGGGRASDGDLDAGAGGASSGDLDVSYDARADGMPPRVDTGPMVVVDAVVTPDAPVDAGPIAPGRVWVGINELPENMLGTTAVVWEGRSQTFRWSVPSVGWTANVTVEHDGRWAPVEMPYLLWRYVSSVGEPKTFEAEDFSPTGGEWVSIHGGHRWTGRLVEPVPGDPGTYSLQAAVDGEISAALAVDLDRLDEAVDPFVDVDHWVVTFSRDRGELMIGPNEQGDLEVGTQRPGVPNGEPDFEEAARAIGLLGGDAAWNQGVLARLRRAMREHIHGFLFQHDAGPGAPGELDDDSVRLVVHFEGDEDLPLAEAWAGLGWSQIAVGGSDPRYLETGETLYGRADIDWNNQAANDNTGSSRGVFTTTFVRVLVTHPLTAALILDYVPAAGGTPFGSLPGDAPFAAPDFDPNDLPPEADAGRAGRFDFMIRMYGMALASVTTHEMGHSLGLVRPGPPPDGLLAGVPGAWVDGEVEGAHIDTPGFNLMQSGSSFDFADALEGPPAFNAVNLAYLRRRIVSRPVLVPKLRCPCDPTGRP